MHYVISLALLLSLQIIDKNPKELSAAITMGELFSVEHVKRVTEMDETRDMKLAPNLKLSDMETGHFQKMKESGAMHVLMWPSMYKRTILCKAITQPYHLQLRVSNIHIPPPFSGLPWLACSHCYHLKVFKIYEIEYM